jgi:hypothetical protein
MRIIAQVSGFITFLVDRLDSPSDPEALGASR